MTLDSISMSRAGGSPVAARVLKFGIAGISAVALFLASAAPAQVIAPAAVPAAAPLRPFYETYRTQPIWFRGGVDNPAVAQLIAILQRAPFDGFAAGPQLALKSKLQPHRHIAAMLRMWPLPNALSQQPGCNMSRPSSGPQPA